MKKTILLITLLFTVSAFAAAPSPSTAGNNGLMPKGSCPGDKAAPPMKRDSNMGPMQDRNRPLDSKTLSCLKKNYSTLIGIRYSYPEVYDVLMDMIKTANIAPCEVETFMGAIMASEEGKNTNMPAPDSMDKQGVMPGQE